MVFSLWGISFLFVAVHTINIFHIQGFFICLNYAVVVHVALATTFTSLTLKSKSRFLRKQNLNLLMKLNQATAISE